jgi:hypothetical protein
MRKKVEAFLMGFWARVFNMEDSTQELAKDTETVPMGIPIAQKTTPEFVRVKKGELEQTYLVNPIVFNFVNKITQVIVSSGYELVGEKKAVSEIDGFLSSIGDVGGEICWDSLLEQIFRDQVIYGEAWVEKIYSKKGDMIVDIDMIDAKKMDYLKNRNEKVMLDLSQNPIGYTETLPFDEVPSEIRHMKVPAPYDEGCKLDNNMLFFPPDRITHFKLYSIGDGLYPVGLVEPCYKASLRKLNMEEALANALYRVGFPIITTTVGDASHDPTPPMITDAMTKTQNIKYNESIAIPYWTKIDLLESKHPEKLREHLDYFCEQEIASSGMPAAFVTGKGEDTNRSTLNRQEYLSKLALKHMIRNTSKVIERDVFRPICLQRGLKSWPKMVWREIVLEELDSKTERIYKYAKAGIITPDKDLEAIIRRSESLPLAIGKAVEKKADGVA